MTIQSIIIFITFAILTAFYSFSVLFV